MTRKLTLLGMAVAAIAAFAIPAAASASPVMKEGATTVPVNAKIVATSTNTLTTNTPLGTLECAKVTIFSKVTENTGTHIHGVGTGGETATCFANKKGVKTALTVTEPKLASIDSTTLGSGTISLSYTADVGGFKCAYAGSGSFSTSIIIVIEIKVTTPTELCRPEEGSMTFEGGYSLETENGTAVTIE